MDEKLGFVEIEVTTPTLTNFSAVVSKALKMNVVKFNDWYDENVTSRIGVRKLGNFFIAATEEMILHEHVAGVTCQTIHESRNTLYRWGGYDDFDTACQGYISALRDHEHVKKVFIPVSIYHKIVDYARLYDLVNTYEPSKIINAFPYNIQGESPDE